MDHESAKRQALADLGALVSDTPTPAYERTVPTTPESTIASLRAEIEALRSENFKLRWNFQQGNANGEARDMCVGEFPWYEGYDSDGLGWISDEEFITFQKTLKPSKRAKVPRR